MAAHQISSSQLRPVAATHHKQKDTAMMRSTEDIDARIDTRLSYRQGWPTLPALPLYTAALAYHSFPNYETHLERVENILNAQGVGVSQVMVVHRVHYQSQPDGSTATLTIVCKQGSTPWYLAIREIRRYLAGQGIDITIEFIDQRAYHNLSTFPIMPNDRDIIHRWHSTVESQVLNILRASGRPWAFLNVWRRGLEDTSNLCSPTVVIFAPNAAHHEWWETILPRIRSVCMPMFDVELLEGGRITYGDKDDMESPANQLTLEDFGPKIEMGTSCGVLGSESSGTIGGIVRLWKEGRDLGMFGLSNHHVVLTDQLKQGKLFLPKSL